MELFSWYTGHPSPTPPWVLDYYFEMTWDEVYDRLRRYSTVESSGCWIWHGERTAKGYGRIKIRGRKYRVHRLALMTLRPFDPTLTVDHLADRCTSRACWNPDHLEAVTNRENILRGMGPAAHNARKTHCPRGHELAGDNLVASNPNRSCLTCAREYQRNIPPEKKREYSRRYYERRKARKAALP